MWRCDPVALGPQEWLAGEGCFVSGGCAAGCCDVGGDVGGREPGFGCGVGHGAHASGVLDDDRVVETAGRELHRVDRFTDTDRFMAEGTLAAGVGFDSEAGLLHTQQDTSSAETMQPLVDEVGWVFDLVHILVGGLADPPVRFQPAQRRTEPL